MVNWGGWGCSKRGVVGGWQGVMCGCCQMWMVRMVRVRTGGLAMGRGVGGVAVVHSVIHRQVPVRRAPIGSVHHSGRQGPSRGCECGFNFGKWFWSLNEVTTTVDTSSLIDSWRGSETLNTGNQNMILGAHPRPRPLTQDLQTSDDPSTAWRRHSRRFFCTFQATNTTLLSYTSFTHTDTWNSTADFLPCTVYLCYEVKFEICCQHFLQNRHIPSQFTDGLLCVSIFSLSYISA